jgi:hypothetical protein
MRHSARAQPQSFTANRYLAHTIEFGMSVFVDEESDVWNGIK